MKGICPTCHKLINIKKDGHLYKHGPTTLPCSGSNTLCTKLIEPPINTKHIQVNYKSLEEFIFINKSPTIKHIPTSVNYLITDHLTKLFDNINSDLSNTNHWNNLFTFPFKCLSIPKDKKSISLPNIIKDRLKNIDYLTPLEHIKYPNNSNESFIKTCDKISKKINEGDVCGAQKLISSQSKLAPSNDATLENLKSLHPRASYTSLPNPPPNIPPLTISNQDIRDTINEFNKFSAAGPDGYRPSYFQTFLKSPNSNSFFNSLTSFLNNIITRDIPTLAHQIIFGANLIAFEKPKGGIRPIAIGSFFRRLITKIIAKKIKTVTHSLLGNYQLGCGTKGGVDIASHCLRIYLQHPPLNSVLCKIDFKNAFNTISRSSALESFYDNFPQYSRIVDIWYSNSTPLIFNGYVIYSEEGVQQGDPLGPILFCLAIHNMMKDLKSDFDLDLNLWYLDDGTLCGNQHQISKALFHLERECPKIGLELNKTKIEICILNPEIPLDSFKDYNIIEIDDIQLLGSPLLNNKISEKTIDKTFFELQNLEKFINHIPSHQLFYLLKKCLYLPKISHLFHSSSSFTSSEFFTKHNIRLKTLMERILNLPLSDFNWHLAQLPAKLGGIDLIPLELLSLSLFISNRLSLNSAISSFITPNDDLLTVAIEKWNLLTPDDQTFPTEISNKSILEPLIKKLQNNLNPSDISDIQLLQLNDKYGGYEWLEALPSLTLDNLLTNDQLRVTIGFRLGCSLTHLHTCHLCNLPVQPNARHGLNCSRSQGRHLRHKAINKIIHNALNKAKIPNILEPTNLSLQDGLRPDGLTCIPWSNGKSLIWDATCVSSFPSSINSNPLTNGENKKINKYSILNNFIFQPIVISTNGNFSQSTYSFLKILARKIFNITNEKRESTFLKQKIQLENF
ncbi:uncharacterized protein LOC135924537 [Gordionus sp. m RMFG-2023]|uniref:uncharacterized protein LOC135924537 n=1 Tax=Gordionus sp. m RMFG-2023 TaxID=3053472 RepID=UPI0031FDE670